LIDLGGHAAPMILTGKGGIVQRNRVFQPESGYRPCLLF
jgi:hypothetical protein